MRRPLAVVAGLSLAGGVALAAPQLVPTKTFLVRNPPSGARKVLWRVTQPGSTGNVVGDPTAQGATLRIQLSPGGDQCVTMPSTGWSAIGSIGFKYKDPALANGPVKMAQIRKTPSGTFQLKAILKNGGPISIAVTPGNQTMSYATNFTVGVGDDYCGGTATATPNPNDATTFKVSNDGAPTVCISACNPTTTSSSVTTTFTGTITTTSTSLPQCGDAESPACNGVCPPSLSCVPGVIGCECQALPCGDTHPACDGSCPPGWVCVDGGGFCACIF